MGVQVIVELNLQLNRGGGSNDLFIFTNMGVGFRRIKESSVESKPTEKKSKTKSAPAKKSKPKAAVNEVVDVEESWKPLGLTSKPKDLDDLKRVKGIGAVIEKTLHSLGIYQFQQVADFTEENISWVDNHISFPGRIQREEWVSQAKKLAAGKETEFSKKVDKGEVDY